MVIFHSYVKLPEGTSTNHGPASQNLSIPRFKVTKKKDHDLLLGMTLWKYPWDTTVGARVEVPFGYLT
jgi:hypothetical protein